jgi:hypothetical protein
MVAYAQAALAADVYTQVALMAAAARQALAGETVSVLSAFI